MPDITNTTDSHTTDDIDEEVTINIVILAYKISIKLELHRSER